MADRRARPGRGRVERTIVAGATAAVVLLSLAPVVAVVIMSFTDAGTLQFPPPGLSLRWYARIGEMLWGADADIARLGEAVRTSLGIAGLAVALTALAGVPAAYALGRARGALRALAEPLISLPVVFPTVVLGVALLVIVSRLGVDLGPLRIALAHAVVLLPFMIRNCMASLDGLDPALEEAARTLGASPLRSFAEIVLPAMRPGLISGCLLVFILSLNEFTLTYFLFTIDSFPLSMWLFQASSAHLDPSIFAVSTLVILVNVALILAVERLGGTRGVSV